jgi:hypothetical protein
LTTLTTGVDNALGDAGNNTIDGSSFLSGGAFVPTLSNADSIDGKGGTDTLFVQSPTAGAVATPTSVKGVEIVSIENTSTGTATLNLVNGDALVETVNS